MLSNFLKLLITIVSAAYSKVVILKYKQQIVLMTDVPKINSALLIKNEGSQNVQDF